MQSSRIAYLHSMCMKLVQNVYKIQDTAQKIPIGIFLASTQIPVPSEIALLGKIRIFCWAEGYFLKIKSLESVEFPGLYNMNVMYMYWGLNLFLLLHFDGSWSKFCITLFQFTRFFLYLWIIIAIWLQLYLSKPKISCRKLFYFCITYIYIF